VKTASKKEWTVSRESLLNVWITRAAITGGGTDYNFGQWQYEKQFDVMNLWHMAADTPWLRHLLAQRLRQRLHARAEPG